MSSVENWQAKAIANSRDHFQRPAQRVFLSQAGPRFDLALSQAEHHLPARRVVSVALETKKATRWVALVWLAMRLAS